MTTDHAIAQGFTKPVHADCDGYSLALMVRPAADLDGRFTAWDADTHEFLNLNGWLWTFTDA